MGGVLEKCSCLFDRLPCLSKNQTDPKPSFLFERSLSDLSIISKNGGSVCHLPIRIGAFNVQNFGKAFMNDEEKLETLVRILKRYDIVLLQEIRQEQPLQQLMERLNTRGPNVFEQVVSKGVGLSTRKEHYAYIYQSNRVEVKHVEIREHNAIGRPPFVATFQGNALPISPLVLVGIHTRPTDVKQELDALYDVCDELVKTNTSMIVLGDFNASGSYLTKKDKDDLKFTKDSQWKWIIKDHMPTTYGRGNLAYDRILVHESIEKYIQGDGSVFRYTDEWKDNNNDVPLVSDHFPVEFQLKPIIHEKVLQNVQTVDGFHLEDTRDWNWHRDAEVALDESFFMENSYFKFHRFSNSDLAKCQLEVIAVFQSVQDLVDQVEIFRQKHKHLLSYSLFAQMKFLISQSNCSSTTAKFSLRFLAESKKCVLQVSFYKS